MTDYTFTVNGYEASEPYYKDGKLFAQFVVKGTELERQQFLSENFIQEAAGELNEDNIAFLRTMADEMEAALPVAKPLEDCTC